MWPISVVHVDHTSTTCHCLHIPYYHLLSAGHVDIGNAVIQGLGDGVTVLEEHGQEQIHHVSLCCVQETSP